MSTDFMLNQLPSPFIDRMVDLLGDEIDAFLASYQEPPSVGLRVNTLKLSPQQFSSISPYPLSPIPWAKSGFILPADSRPGKHPYHAAGLFYIQDPSAMAVTELLAPQPGERILDLAAAPGGKSTHIAAKMDGQGLLVTNDIHPRRVGELAKNLERWGGRNIVVLNETPARLAAHFGAAFDGVLVDAPCSGEGMFRKDPAASQEWTLRFVESCAARQADILHEAAKLVRPGGRLVYATCTFAPEEDEGALLRFLAHHPDFELGTPLRYPGFSPGRPAWISAGGTASPDPKVAQLSRAVRLWPHKAPGEGHFIAVLNRSADAMPVPRLKPALTSALVPGDLRKYLDDFNRSTLVWEPPQERLDVQGSHIYLLPEGNIELRGLRVLHWGWWLGTMKVKRFEPSYALVMALRPDDVQQVLDFTQDDDRVMAYLHGEVLPSTGPDGWIMVAVDGYPLGWGKRVQNRLKSHSPKWLRWM